MIKKLFKKNNIYLEYYQALIINLYIHAEFSFKGIFRDSVTFSEETFDAQQALPPVPPDQSANSVEVTNLLIPNY